MEPFVQATKSLGGDLAEAGNMLANAFAAHKNILTIAGRHNKPSNVFIYSFYAK